jgi:hypothetical protein
MAQTKNDCGGISLRRKRCLVRTSKLSLTFPSRERIDSAFAGALAHFLFPSSSATEWQSVRVVFVIFATFICRLIAQLTLCRRCGGIVIIPARSTMLRSSVGRFASGGKGNYNPHPREGRRALLSWCLFPLLSPVWIPAALQSRRSKGVPTPMGHVRSIPQVPTADLSSLRSVRQTSEEELLHAAARIHRG